MEILETIHKLEEPVAFVTWSKQIAYHKCTAYFRKRREVLLDEQEDGYSAFDTLEEDRVEFIPDEALDKEDFKDTIRAMISELPEEQRSALLLRYFNEVSVKEIAQIQGVTEGTVKSRLNYARKAIREAVESYEKKYDIRLHCAGVVPMLLWFFRAYRRAQGMAVTVGSATAVFAVGETAAATAGAAAATGTAAGTAAAKTGIFGSIKAFAQTLAGKIVAGVTAAAVVAGGTAVVVEQLRDPYELPEKWSGYAETCSTDALGEEMNVLFELEIHEVLENSYAGTLAVTWEDGEAYSSECEIELSSEKEARLGYDIYIDPLFLRGFSEDPMHSHYTNILILTYDRDADTAWLVMQLSSADGQPYTRRIDLTREPSSADSVLRSGRDELRIWTDEDSQICVMDPDGAYTWMSGVEYREVLQANGGYFPSDTAVFVRYGGSQELELWYLEQTAYKEKIEIPAQIDGCPVTRINAQVFSWVNGLQELQIPEGVEWLGGYAFSCGSLRSVTLPASLTQVDGPLFADCDALESVEVAAGNPVYHSAGNCLIETESGILIAGCAASRIPDDGSVTAIGPYAFMWLRELTYLEIPEGVKEIGYCAFQQSVWLEEIHLPASLEQIGQNAFRFCHRLKTVRYGGTVEQFRAIRGLDRLGTDFACTVYCTDGILTIG